VTWLCSRLGVKGGCVRPTLHWISGFNAFGLMTVKEAGVAVGGVRRRIPHADREVNGLQMLALQENYGIPSLRTLQ